MANTGMAGNDGAGEQAGSGDGFFDRTKSNAAKGNTKKNPLVTVKPLALVDFLTRGVAALRVVCDKRPLTSNKPDAFLVDQSNEPEQMLILVPIIGEDARAFPISWSEGGRRAHCNLFEAFAEYGIKTFTDVNAGMPVAPYQHPKYGWVLALYYSDPILEPVKHRKKPQG